MGWDLVDNKELPQRPQSVADPLWPLTFVRITCGKSKTLSTQQTTANGDTEEAALNKDVPVKQGLFQFNVAQIQI